MKKIQLLFVSLLIAHQGISQTTLFSENFESGNAFTINTADLGGTSTFNTWLVNNSYSGGSGTLVCLGFPFNFTVGNTPQQPGSITGAPSSNYMHIAAQAAVSSGINCASYVAADDLCVTAETHFSKMTSPISTTGLTGITFSCWWMCAGSASAYGEIYYSLDNGSTWVLKESNLNNQSSWTQSSFTDVAWDNQPSLQFAFRFVNSTATTGSDPSFSVDEITIVQSCIATSSAIAETACDSYTSPSGNYVWTESNTYFDTIPNAAGCDSVMTINLTIETVDVSVTQDGAVLTANEFGATYQWLACPSLTPIDNATGQSYVATMNGEYAVLVSSHGCTDTSECFTVVTVGVFESSFGHQPVLYPNPTRGDFSIDLGERYSSVRITLADLSGRIIQSNEYAESQLLFLNIEEPAGIYLLHIESGEKKAVIRLVKE